MRLVSTIAAGAAVFCAVPASAVAIFSVKQIGAYVDMAASAALDLSGYASAVGFRVRDRCVAVPRQPLPAAARGLWDAPRLIGVAVRCKG
jgi:hypothetical protein